MCCHLNATDPFLVSGVSVLHATVIQDIMPVSLVVSNPTSMPVYNSVDLDEVQPLARYCFSLFQFPGHFFFCRYYIHCCVQTHVPFFLSLSFFVRKSLQSDP